MCAVGNFSAKNKLEHSIHAFETPQCPALNQAQSILQKSPILLVHLFKIESYFEHHTNICYVQEKHIYPKNTLERNNLVISLT